MIKKTLAGVLISTVCLCAGGAVADDVSPNAEKSIICSLSFDEAEGLEVKDNSGNEVHGRICNFDGSSLSAETEQKIRSKGIAGRAVKLDGSQKIVLPKHEGFSIEGPFTLEMWIKTTGGGGWLFYTNAYINNWDCGLKLRDTGREIQLNITKSREERKSISSGMDVRDGKWHYVAAVYDGTLMKLFIDGVLDHKAVGAYEGGCHPMRSANIGGGIKNCFAGEIDEVTIWKGALTAEEIKARYDKLSGAH